MWCAISLWKHCHRRAYFTSPPDAGLPLWQGFSIQDKEQSCLSRACLAVSLRTAQQGQHKGAMSFTVQWKVKAERKPVITAFQLAVEMLSALIFLSYARIDIFPIQQTMLVFNHKNYHQTIFLLSSLVPRNSINVCELTQQYRTMSLWGIFHWHGLKVESETECTDKLIVNSLNVCSLHTTACPVCKYILYVYIILHNTYVSLKIGEK